MLNLKKVLKSYSETGSLNEQVNLYGFVDPHTFLTKSGDVGVILQVHGVDYECLDPNSLDTLTKRLESALKLLDENFRIYQYLFKRNNEPIPYKKYANPIVNTAIENRIRHFAEKSETAVFASNVLRRHLRGLPLQAGSVKVAHRVSQESKEGTRRPERCVLIAQTSRSPRPGDHKSTYCSPPKGEELPPAGQRLCPGRTPRKAGRLSAF